MVAQRAAMPRAPRHRRPALAVEAGTSDPADHPALQPAPPRPVRRPAADETLRLYAGDWAGFVRWCRQQGHVPLPARPETVAAYLGAEAARLSHGALRRRLAAIADAHRRCGAEPPLVDPVVKEILRTAPAGRGVARDPANRRRATPLPTGQLLRMAAACPGDLAGQRDRALLLLAAAAAAAPGGGRGLGRPLGRNALLGLDAEHVRFTATGVELVLADRRSDAVCTVSLQRGLARVTCPVQALQTWLHASETRFGPVFRKVNRWGGVEYGRLGADALRRIWTKRKAPRAQARVSAKGHRSHHSQWSRRRAVPADTR